MTDPNETVRALLAPGSLTLEDIENVATKAAGGLVAYVSWLVMDKAPGLSPRDRKAVEKQLVQHLAQRIVAKMETITG